MTVSLAALAALLAASILPAAQSRPGVCVNPAFCGAASLIPVGGHGSGSGGMGRASGGGMGAGTTGGATGGGMGTGTTGGMGSTTGGGMSAGRTGNLGSPFNDATRQSETAPQTNGVIATQAERQNRCVTPSGSCSFPASSAAVKGTQCHCAGAPELGRFE